MKIDWKQIRIKDLATIVYKELNKKGIDSILVGGACISIYTINFELSKLLRHFGEH